MRSIFCFFCFGLFFSNCAKNSEENVTADMAISTVELPAKAESISGTDKDIPQKIIKNASLRFETDDLEKTFNQVQTAIKENKGSVQNDYQEKNYNNISRSITVRVPTEKFDSFLEAISKGVSYFDEKNISSQNVTEEFIDLNSRLNTKRKLEARYLEILQKANKISEILEIEKQISVIREEIEAKEGRLKYLENRVSESTVTINFYKTTAQKEGVKISYGSKIWTAIKSGFFSLSEFLISIISLWPFIILFVVLVYFIRKRFKRKKA